MNNNNRIKQIIQALISKTEVEKICKKYEYVDTARKLTTLVLFQYFILSAILETKSFRELSLQGKMYGLPQVDYSTLSKKASEVPYQIFLDMFYLIFNKCNRTTKRKICSKYGRILKILDSTCITAHKNKWKWTEFEKNRSGIKFHTAYLVDSGIPSQILATPIKVADSTVLEQFAEDGTLLICDRGYRSIKKMCEFDFTLQEFVIRLSNDIRKFNQKPFDIPHNSSKYQDYLCTLGTSRHVAKEYREHQIRVVEFYNEKGEFVRLCTNVYDLSAEEIAEIYKIRWQIECFFRELKQNFTIKNIFGKSPNSVFSQGIIAFICYMSTHCIYVDVKKILDFKFSFVEFLRRLKYNAFSFSNRNFQALLLRLFC